MKTKTNGMRLLLLTFLLVVLYGCSGGTDYKMTIGEAGEDGVLKEVGDFERGELIGFETQGKKSFGTSSLRILFVEHEGKTERIIDEFNQTIDPTWNWHYNYYDNADLGAGDYSVKVFSGSELLAIKRFRVK